MSRVSICRLRFDVSSFYCFMTIVRYLFSRSVLLFYSGRLIDGRSTSLGNFCVLDLILCTSKVLGQFPFSIDIY